MQAYDLARVALLQMYRNRRRYKSAFVGISLGIAALVTVVTTGDSVEQSLGLNIELMGSATILKAEWDYGKTQRWHHGQYRLADAEDLRRIPNVVEAAPSVCPVESAVICKNKKIVARIMGIGPEFFKVNRMQIDKGRQFIAEDVRENRHLCIIGKKIEEKLFGGMKSLGATIMVQGMAFQVIGTFGDEMDEAYKRTVALPISVAMTKIPRMDRIIALYARATNWDTVPGVYKNMLEILRNNQPGYAEAIRVTYFGDQLKIMKTIIGVFKIFLYAAIVVTLVLGGLGITNVMLAVVSERTKEVGLRKAVGATESMIILQFLCESLTISLIGAGMGIVLGVASVQMVRTGLDITPNYSVLLLSLFLSVLIGLFLGVVSGILPARKAGILDPVDAMRFE